MNLHMLKNRDRDESERANRHRALLESALAANFGDRDWRLWKEGEAARVVELTRRAPRFDVLAIRLDGDFDVLYAVDMPVPCAPRDGCLVVRRGAVFHLKYLAEWRHEPPPGWAPLGVMTPGDVYHPNVRPGLGLMRSAMCLGHLPAGVSPQEIIFTGHDGVLLQCLVLDPEDPAGVLNPLACEFYRDPHQQKYLPLSKAGLFEPWDGTVSCGEEVLS
jgi:hypothetical protein